MTDSELAEALGQALTGELLPLDDPAALAGQLAAAGFSPARLQALRAQRQAAKAPWPFPVPLERRRELGFARFDAALAEARASLGLAGLNPAAQAVRGLNRDELRLAADRPPHWG